MESGKWFTGKLMEWHTHHNHREMPWKGEKDPYRIWLSEVILQQTRVAQGMKYYERFLEAFPTVQHLADAGDDEVMKMWEGLGYYSRARNLRAAAKTIAYDYRGSFPTTAAGWLQLKGVGPYTAAAIASFAFGEAVPVVDGNVYRILSRVFGIHTPIDTTEGKRQFALLAMDLLYAQDPAAYNQAMMDFGATVCTPAAPDCNSCPLHVSCLAFRQDMVPVLPVKTKQIVRKVRHFHYLDFRDGDRRYLVKRQGRDIWQGLHEFPMIESAHPLQAEEVRQAAAKAGWLHEQMAISPVGKVFRQLLTHQEVYGHIYVVEGSPILPEQFIVTDRQKMATFAFPRLLNWYLSDNALYLFR